MLRRGKNEGKKRDCPLGTENTFQSSCSREPSQYFEYLARQVLDVCRRWMPRSTMRPAEGDASDCILVVGVSRSKMAVAFLSVALLSLFLTFHILYDSAVYSLHAVSAVEGRTVELVSQVRVS